MWIVLIMGATVTNTGSQTGCGPSWPLCRGQFIPQFAVSTFIEFSHRAVVGVESVLVIAFAIAAWTLYRSRPEVRVMAPMMVGFLFVQAGLGAWAVMAPQEPAVLALHFGVSLIAFASVVLTAAIAFETPRWNAVRIATLPSRFGLGVWSLTLFCYLVVYLGAYVRHAKADDACKGWPLCNGKALPGFTGAVGTAFAHRFGALVLVLGVLGLVLWTSRFRAARPDLWMASLMAGILVMLQAITGAIVNATDVDLFSALAHAGIIALLFATLCFLSLRAMPQTVPASESVRGVAAVEPAS